MAAIIVERLECRALMSASVDREVVPFDFSGPSIIVEGVEPIDMHFTGTDTITTVSNGNQVHTLVQEETSGTGTGLVTGQQYTLVERAVITDNTSPNGRDVSQLVLHDTLTFADGTIVRQTVISHFQVKPDGTLHIFDKVVVPGS